MTSLPKTVKDYVDQPFENLAYLAFVNGRRIRDISFLKNQGIYLAEGADKRLFTLTGDEEITLTHYQEMEPK